MDNQELAFAPAHRLKEMIARKKISVRELTDFFLKRIDAYNPDLNAFLYLNGEEARKQASRSDKNGVEAGKTHPLWGIPTAVPDVVDMKGTPTTLGSILYKEHIFDEDSVEVARLKSDGAVILGKTNVAEFGLCYDTINKLLPPCVNPWNGRYSAGGGAGGNAVAVAAGLIPIALGTDFHGALRMSCSFCGVFGIAPTRGRIPIIRPHLLSFTDKKFYRKGVCSRNVRDMAQMLGVLARRDANNRTCCGSPEENYEARLLEPLGKLKIAWSPDLGFLPVEKRVLNAVEKGANQLEKLGHAIERANLGIDQDVTHHFLHLFSADRYLLVMRSIQDHPQNYGLLSDPIKEWLRMGDKVTGVQYSLAISYMQALEQKLDTLLEEFDMILTPAVPAAPFPLMEPPATLEGKPVPPYVGLWNFLLPFNMSGHPALVVPCGLDDRGMPIGMQIVGRKFSEALMLALAHAYEQAHPMPIVKGFAG